MTGPGHYKEAERLLGMVQQPTRGYLESLTPEGLVNDIALAQVHATLALAAATAYPAIVAYCGDEATEPREWTKATS